MRPRRTIPKRVVVWTVVVVLMLYVNSMPLSTYLVQTHCPQAFPIWRDVYWPLRKHMHSDLPGAEVLKAYTGGCETGIYMLLRPRRTPDSLP